MGSAALHFTTKASPVWALVSRALALENAKMYSLKYTVDILSSIASIIAIITVLLAWHRSVQKALKIERVVIHRKDSDSTYILVIKNRKQYPVIIKSISGFKRRLYKVEKKENQSTEYDSILNYSDCVLESKDVFEMGASGNTDIRVNGITTQDDLHKLLFSLHTSHGYHEILCSNIITLNMNISEVYGLEFRYQYESLIKAKAKYYWLRFLEIIKRES